MKLEDFKEINKDKSVYEKVLLLAKTMETRGDDRICMQIADMNRNYEDVAYCSREAKAMADRVSWLLDSIGDDLGVTTFDTVS